MIKLQDFARQMGVTDRAIQKHLRNYAAEFEGLYQRKGPNGTWLTDEACELLRSKMRLQPIVVGDAQAINDLEAAQKRIADLLEEKATLATQVAVLSAWKAEKAMLVASAESIQRQLEDAQGQNESLRRALEEARGFVETCEEHMAADDEARRELIEELTAAQERRERDLEAQEAEFVKKLSEARQEASEEAKVAAEKNATLEIERIKKAHETEIAAVQETLDAERAKRQALEDRTLWDYLRELIFGKREG